MVRTVTNRDVEVSFRACLSYQLKAESCGFLRYNPRHACRTRSWTKAVGMVPDEMKWEPKSKGLTTPRKKKPKELAVITECCTGCAGSPACVEYCPVEDCMFWVPDEDSTPFGRIAVDPILCIGCKKCLSKGPDGCFLDGCPWDAIAMVDNAEVEKEVGAMAICCRFSAISLRSADPEPKA
jgi:ferredoxin